jgi:hypothetical protein
LLKLSSIRKLTLLVVDLIRTSETINTAHTTLLGKQAGRRPPSPGESVFKARDGGAIKNVSRAFARIAGKMGLNKGIDDPRYKVVLYT